MTDTPAQFADAGPYRNRYEDERAAEAAGPPAPALEVYREDRPGAYMPAKDTGTPCYHVYAGGAWYELYDFGPPRAVSAVYYGTQANREALGRKCEPWELPARIAARVAELVSAQAAEADARNADPGAACGYVPWPPEGTP